MPKIEEDNWINLASRAVENAIVESADHLYHLVIILGTSTPLRSIFLKKLRMKINSAVYINMGFEVSKVLKDIPPCDRKNEVESTVRRISEQIKGDVILLDGLDVLLDPDLEFDPVRFLRNVSRSRNIVASIDGECVNGVFTYSEQGNSEHRRLNVGNAVIIDLRRIGS